MENKFQNKVNGAMFTLGKTAFNVVHAPEILVDKAKEHKKEKLFRSIISDCNKLAATMETEGEWTDEEKERIGAEIQRCKAMLFSE